jgi:hypothetical protein
MMRNTLVLAALAVAAIAGPCKPTGSSTELLSATIRSTETPYVETSVTEVTSSAAVTDSTDVVSSIASSDATTTTEATTTTAAPDTCAESLGDMGGEPDFTDKIADCQDFNVVTISSYEV